MIIHICMQKQLMKEENELKESGIQEDLEGGKAGRDANIL